MINVNSKILITGANGFLGRHLVEELETNGYDNILGHPGTGLIGDFRQQDYTEEYVKFRRPDCIIHLAARVGGIGANQMYPGQFIYENLIMGANLVEAARKSNVSKFISMGTVCMYPKFTTVPFKEEDLWCGYPEETNAPYGIAKKTLMELIHAYRKQYEFNGITLIPTNLYGPGDNFNDATSHVIPALIKKIKKAVENNSKEVVVWGSGSPTREFLYVKDCARAIRLAMENYSEDAPVNIGTGQEIAIKDLVLKIRAAMGFSGEVVFDTSKPDGQPRRCLNVDRAKQFGFEAQVSLDDGLKKTIDWYKDFIRI